jgi:hypothetical protein
VGSAELSSIINPRLEFKELLVCRTAGFRAAIFGADKLVFELLETVVLVLLEFKSADFESTFLPLTKTIVSLPLRNEVTLLEK